MNHIIKNNKNSHRFDINFGLSKPVFLALCLSSEQSNETSALRCDGELTKTLSFCFIPSSGAFVNTSSYYIKDLKMSCFLILCILWI